MSGGEYEIQFWTPNAHNLNNQLDAGDVRTERFYFIHRRLGKYTYERLARVVPKETTAKTEGNHRRCRNCDVIFFLTPTSPKQTICDTCWDIIEKPLDRVKELREEMRHREAADILEGLAAEAPESFTWKSFLADSYKELGMYDECIALYREITLARPELSYGGSIGLFHALLHTKRFREAYSELKRFQKVSYHVDYAKIMEEVIQKFDTLEAYFDEETHIHDYEESIDRCTRAIKEHPWKVSNYVKRANSYYNCSQYLNAIPDYDNALRMEPDIGIHHENRGCAHFHVKNFKHALDDLQRAESLGAIKDTSYFFRGTIYHSFGNYEEAISDFTTAIEMDNEYTEAIAGRGRSLAKIEKYDDALADFSKSIELDDNVLVVGDRADLYDLMGESEKAAADRRWVEDLRNYRDRDANSFDLEN